MPDCTEQWNEVDRQSALVDAAGEAYDQAATSLMFYTQQLVDAIEAAMACETGQGEIIQERSSVEAGRELAALRRVAKTLSKLARRKA